MFTTDFQMWLENKDVDTVDYVLMNGDARQEINAEYLRERLELNKRYKLEDLEAICPEINIEMTDLRVKKGKIISGVLVNILSNSYETSKRFNSLFFSNNFNNQILAIG